MLPGLPVAANQPMVMPEPLLDDVPPHVVDAWRAPILTPSVSSQAPSQSGLTLPSLWWVTQQFGQNMVEQWRAYPGVNRGPGRVDLRVRSDVWSRASSIDRYAFVNHLGIVASGFGYNLLVFDRRRNILSAYTCDFAVLKQVAQISPLDVNPNQSSPPLDVVPSCQIWLNPNFATRPF